jgi:N,N'-diacetyllegionaminate synthase
MSNGGLFIIAEIAQAHDGSLGILHSYIDALAAAGVSAVKFQTHIAKAESSAYEPFRVKFSYVDDTRFDYWKRMEFTREQWHGIKQHCDDAGVEFISSPFSNAAVDLLEDVGVKRYKVGSGEVSNFLLLEKLASTGKPVILSSGMSSFAEVDKAVGFLQSRNTEVSVMQCTTAYPTVPAQWGLNVIAELQSRYGLPVGFSDHSGVIYPSVAAVALGASLLEFHAVFDRRMFGPDAKASLTIDEIAELVRACKMVQTSVQTTVRKDDTSAVIALKQIFEKSLAVNKDLPAGHVLQFADLEAKKPKGYGIDAKNFESVIGRTLKNDLKAYDFLNDTDI